jgi:hypothetical protein
MRWIVALLLPIAALGGPAADTARAVREIAFDRDECYRIRDMSIMRGDVRVYLTDGYLIFSKPVAGRRIAAVFTTEVEGGDGEVIVMPPTKGERRSLASYTGSPTFNERFRNAVFLSTADLHGELMAQMSANPTNRKVLEMAPLLDEQWREVLRNISSSYETRLVLDLVSASPREESLFTGIFAGVNMGNFDIVVDPRALESVVLGQVNSRENRVFFDVWTSFEPRRRSGPPPDWFATLSDYRIEATIEPDLTLQAVTRVKVIPRRDRIVAIPFEISRNVEVASLSVDGQPAEVLQRDSLRANLARAGNELFLVVPPEPLRQGRSYEFEFRHSGRVVFDSGDRVFYVSARGNWYPAHGIQFATYDLRFRYPRDLDLVSAGEVVEDTTDAEWRITTRRTKAPIRVAGFNLGNYTRVRVTRGPYAVEAYANRALERALQPAPSPVLIPPPPQLPPRRGVRMQMPEIAPIPTAPDPAANLRPLASEVAEAIEFMAEKFGPPALPLVTVSPIPGTFGQGFPGLIYLSTLSYLSPRSAPVRPLNPQQQLFFGEILHAHEAAHQWWGNVVSSAGYHDNWLMEALANYSALLFLEKRKGKRAFDSVLADYRNHLLQENETGETIESAGPIVLGTRLESSLEPQGWRAITYGKGSWIMHMLRSHMGDERFFPMLAELRRRYERREVTTEQFRLLASEFMPPKSDDPKLEIFFDQWVYGTGIPALKLSHSVRGKAPSLKLVGTITQTGVSDDFTVLVPVEVQYARGKSTTHWVRTSSEPVSFSLALRQPPTRVTLDPQSNVLRR